MINDKGTIQYVAHVDGVQIIGQLPAHLSHIKLKMEVTIQLKNVFALVMFTFLIKFKETTKVI